MRVWVQEWKEISPCGKYLFRNSNVFKDWEKNSTEGFMCGMHRDLTLILQNQFFRFMKMTIRMVLLHVLWNDKSCYRELS